MSNLTLKLSYFLAFFLQRVNGEIYKIDERMLQRLDELENHPHFYQRTVIDVEQSSSLQTARNQSGSQPNRNSCFVYVLPNFKESLLSQPFLQNYECTPSNLYVRPDQRDPSFNLMKVVKNKHLNSSL